MSARNSFSHALRGHLQTLIPYFLRQTALPPFAELEIPTPDRDVLDARLYRGSGEGLAILTHGLEGSFDSFYIRTLARVYLSRGWSVLCWNLRGCGQRLNRQTRLYHSGAAEDLLEVVKFARPISESGPLELAGFSLGGNLTLVALARFGPVLESLGVRKALAVSVPLNLAASSRKLEHWFTFPYRMRFLAALREKVRRKEQQFPGFYPLDAVQRAGRLRDFDDVLTAPLHGFADAADYYRQCSALFHLEHIRIPVDLLIARNDPVLARGNYEEAGRINPGMISFHLTEEGGHCGFAPEAYRKLIW